MFTRKTKLRFMSVWAVGGIVAVASAAVVVVVFASMTGSAYADHDPEHSIKDFKGGLKALEERVWDCEHGTGGALGPCPGIGSKTVFVTSGTFTGDLKTQGGALTGLRGGDEICQAAAEQGVVPPDTYIAWLSTSAKDAIDRLSDGATEYVLPSGIKVADGKADLVSCPGDICLDHPISEDEFGIALVGADNFVWTGTTAAGTAKSALEECDGWSTDAGGNFGSVGRTGDAGCGPGPPVGVLCSEIWTNDSFGACGGSFGLYCFQR